MVTYTTVGKLALESTHDGGEGISLGTLTRLCNLDTVEISNT